MSIFFLKNNSLAQQQTEPRFGGAQINIRVLNVQLYHEFGSKSINHWGFNGALGIYRNLFIGGYRQSGQHNFIEENLLNESSYRHGGVLLGYRAPSGIKKLYLSPIVQLGWGKIKSDQSLPFAYEDVEQKFSIISPKLELQYHFIPVLSLTCSAGYHFYNKKDSNRLPDNFTAINLNDYFFQIGLKLGV